MDVLNQLCGVCDSPVVNTENMPCGSLTSSRHYSKETYNVPLCWACFGRCLAGLRRERLVHTMFNDVQDDLENFGRVSTSQK
jgi:hypothetical protein